MVKIVRASEVDATTPQTSGMRRVAALAPSTADTKGLWMGIAHNDPGAKSGVHHHGDAESGIFILKGSIIFRWGDKLEFEDVAHEGDFIYVAPNEIHMEENMSAEEPAALLLARNATEYMMFNVDDPRDGSAAKEDCD
jgi:uncharacterized RmlC-like cupin family protein